MKEFGARYPVYTIEQRVFKLHTQHSPAAHVAIATVCDVATHATQCRWFFGSVEKGHIQAAGFLMGADETSMGH